jgi:hypothetical protein
MKRITHFIRLFILTVLVLIGFITSTHAQEVSIPDPGLNAAIREALQKPSGPMTDQDLLSLTNLDASSRNVSSVEGLAAARNLNVLFLTSNRLTNFALPTTVTNLTELDISLNPLTNCTLPSGLANLRKLGIEFGSLTQLTLPAGLTGLTELDLGVNVLTSLTLPPDATNLVGLSLFFNQLTNLSLPAGLTRLVALDLDGNKLTRLTLPSDLTNLGNILLRDNQLSDLALPAGLSRLSFLGLDGNQLTQFSFPAGLTNLFTVGLTGNQLTNLTLPPDLTELHSLFVDGNPFTTLVLSEPQAATNLAGTVAFLRNQGVSVHTYPLTVSLNAPHRAANGNFKFTLAGPPGTYAVLSSTNLISWDHLGAATNGLGRVDFADVFSSNAPQQFYRANSILGQPEN